MLAAVGRFEMAPLLSALRAMAENDNGAYDHELRQLGADLRHDSGWGVAYRDGAGLTRRRSTAPCFADDAFGELSAVDTGMALLHARRTKEPNTVAPANTHPFIADLHGETYAFCHNGEVTDRSQFSWDRSLRVEGSIDSEELFLHLITRLDPTRPASSLRETLAHVHDFTSLNCLLATRSSLVAYSRFAPGTTRPLYYTLWHGIGEGVQVVSSETIDGLGVEWRRIESGDALEIRA